VTQHLSGTVNARNPITTIEKRAAKVSGAAADVEHPPGPGEAGAYVVFEHGL
jgi:hypothetical protein